MNSKVQEFSQTLEKAHKLVQQVSKDMDKYYEDCQSLEDEDEDEMEEIDNLDLGDSINKVAKKAEELEKKFKKVVK